MLDGSFGTKGALPGPNFMIQAGFGKQVGGNLFQSFNQFNLNSSQSATFSGPNNVHNILARVTNGSPSSIDGTVNSSIQGANLFFLNPTGVIFGQHAQVNVSGSFAVSTANYLKLADGGRFNANLGGGDVLTSAPVSAFGFLNSAPAPVSITGTNTIDVLTNSITPGGGLTVSAQKCLSVVAGDITMNRGAISGDGARINVISVGSAGEVQLNPADFNSYVDTSEFAELGAIHLKNLALIDSSGPSSGTIMVRAENLYLNNSQIVSEPSTSVAGGIIDITTRESIEITPGGVISSSTRTSGNGGNILIDTKSLRIQSAFDRDGRVPKTGIFADTGAFDYNIGSNVGTGGGGNITVTADAIRIGVGGIISSSTFFMGNGGTITLNAGSLKIDAGGILSQSVVYPEELGGNAGNVFVQAHNLTITNEGYISSATYSHGKGGNVRVTADKLTINGGGITSGTDSTSDGDAGNITVKAGQLTLVSNPGESYPVISSSSGSLGKGGDIDIAADTILIRGYGSGIVSNTTDISENAGNAGSITVRARDLKITDGAGISSSTDGTGNGGSVEVIAHSLLIDGTISPPPPGTILGGARTGIFATAGDPSGGVFFQQIKANSGNIDVRADALRIVNAGQISSSTFDSGNAGRITVHAGEVTIAEGGTISSSTSAIGNGGDVILHSGSLSIDGSATPGFATGIFAASFGSGEAGSVSIKTTGSVKLKHGATIATTSETTDAGSIGIISGGEIKLKDQSSITVSAGRNGGDIRLTAPELVYLLDSSITATAGGIGGSGTGGNITIDPQFIVLQNSFISANAAVGQGGNINLVSDFLFNSDLSNNNITATGTTNGIVNITAPQLDLGAQLITLPSSLVSAENQLQERCTALLRGDFSSFISIGRGGTEPAPEELQVEF